jgi:hypothetical protein
VSPVKYELGFYMPEDDILHSHRREILRCYDQTCCLVRSLFSVILLNGRNTNSTTNYIRTLTHKCGWTSCGDGRLLPLVCATFPVLHRTCGVNLLIRVRFQSVLSPQHEHGRDVFISHWPHHARVMYTRIHSQ